jgi:hypothetical protein
MKKLLFVGPLVVATAAAALAQGTVNFQTRIPYYGINAPVTELCGTQLLTGTAFWAQLYWGPTLESLVAVGSPANFRTGPLAGYVGAGAVTMESTTPVYVQMRAWNAPNATFEAAVAARGGKIGWSNSIQLTPGLYDATKPPVNLIGLQGFDIYCPEPSTTALALLGAAALLLRRRS